jgi:hypothetical protein
MIRKTTGLTLTLALLAVLTGATPPAAPSPTGCYVPGADPEPPEYYQIKLVTTKNLSGTRLARGTADVTYASSPFGVSISGTGSYVYNLDISIDNMKMQPSGVYAVWVTTPNLDKVELVGTLDENHQLKGRVEWNKFLVVVTHEESADALGAMWKGPIVLRGMSRSGMMHTMAGHGPFQTEPCAVYGYS